MSIVFFTKYTHLFMEIHTKIAIPNISAARPHSLKIPRCYQISLPIRFHEKISLFYIEIKVFLWYNNVDSFIAHNCCRRIRKR